jgi:hypothetical protein
MLSSNLPSVNRIRLLVGSSSPPRSSRSVGVCSHGSSSGSGSGSGQSGEVWTLKDLESLVHTNTHTPRVICRRVNLDFQASFVLRSASTKLSTAFTAFARVGKKASGGNWQFAVSLHKQDAFGRGLDPDVKKPAVISPLATYGARSGWCVDDQYKKYYMTFYDGRTVPCSASQKPRWALQCCQRP